MATRETGWAPWVLAVITLVIVAVNPAAAADPWVVYPGGDGPGKGKHVVLVSGDEEYRSEEGLPQLGKILARHHGFKCTVLFAINPEDGTIDPDNRRNIPGLEALRTADLMIIATRFRELPDEQMQYVAEYLEAGKPVLGMRAAVVAFSVKPGEKYAKYGFQSTEWPGGFGQQVLGQTWISHHGQHGKESTRGVIAPGAEQHPIVRGCDDIWGPTDVYTVRLPLPGDSKPLVLGQVLSGMNPTDTARDRQEERSADARRLDQDLPRCTEPSRPGVHDDDGGCHGPGERGIPAAPGERCLLVRRLGGQDPAAGQRDPGRDIPAHAIRIRCVPAEASSRPSTPCRRRRPS